MPASEVGAQGLPPPNASLKGTKSSQTEGMDQKEGLALGQLTLALWACNAALVSPLGN